MELTGTEEVNRPLDSEVTDNSVIDNSFQCYNLRKRND